MGEFRVHHVRFFDYVPDAIHCLAYEESSQRLAVSRACGSIEIWSLTDNWYHEKTIPTSPGHSVEGLVWCGARLFSAGLNGSLQEYDLLTLTSKYSVSANAGAVWCLTINDEKTHIAAGTEDGCVVLFEVTDEGALYSRALDRQEGRILSVAWHSGERRIVTGGVDNIRVWSVESGHAVQRLTLGRSERNKETIVWAVGITKDFTIVSGDSRGKTSFWNGKQGTLIRGFQSHKADVLAVAVEKEGTSVFSSGVDPTLVQFEFIATDANSDWRTWVRSNVCNQHTHDVRALTLTDSHVVSAGVDTQLIYNHLAAEKGIKKWHRIPAIPQVPVVYTAVSANVIMFRYRDYLELWKLGSTNRNSEKNGDVLALRNNPVRLLQIKSKGGEQIVSAAISQDAQWLAYSDAYQIRLFHITLEEADLMVPKVSVSRVRYQPPDTLPAQCLCFTPEGAQLISATSSGSVQVMGTDMVRPQLLHTHPPPKNVDVGIHLLAVSPSGRFFAVADHQNNVHVYKVPKHKYVCSLPSYKFKPTAIGFHPTSPEIAVSYCDQRIVEYNFEQKEYTLWSRHFNTSPNTQWQRRQSKLTQIFYVPQRPNQLIVRDEQMFCIIDKTQPFPGTKDRLFVKKLSQKESDTKTKHCFHICNNFKFLLGVATMADDFLLVVERPPLAINEQLPEALRVKKFGT